VRAQQEGSPPPRTEPHRRLAGRAVGFDVDVQRADAERVSLVASGPIDIDVDYRLRSVPDGAEVQAAVSGLAIRNGARIVAGGTTTTGDQTDFALAGSPRGSSTSTSARAGS
jgi:hypothetical protein